MTFKPQDRFIVPGADERNSLGSVRRVYADNRFHTPVFNREATKPLNRFSQIGITNNNTLNCANPNAPREDLSYGSQSREVGFRANVRQSQAQKDYQQGVNTFGYAPGRPLIVNNHQ